MPLKRNNGTCLACGGSPIEPTFEDYCCGSCWFTHAPSGLNDWVDEKAEKKKAKQILQKAKLIDDEAEDELFNKINNPFMAKKKQPDIIPTTATIVSVNPPLPDVRAIPMFPDKVIPIYKEVDHKSRGHAPYSPSMLDKLADCPHYTSDQTGDKSAAEAGTLQHEAVDSGDHSKLDEWQKRAVEKCEGYRKLLIRPGSKVLNEVQIEYLDQWGYTDLCVFTGTHCDLVDWKFGRTPVKDAEENRQGFAYAWGIFNAYPEVQTIKVHFVAPYLDTISTADLSRKDFWRIIENITTVVANAKNPNSPYNTGKHCDYCGSKATCPALMGKALEIVGRYDNLPIPTEVHSSQITDPNDMAKAYNIAGILEKWCKSVKVHALELALNGVEIPGFEICERKGNRTLGDANMVYNLVKDELTPDEFITATKVSAAELETIYCSKAPRGQKAAYKQKLEDTLIDNDLLERGAVSRYLKAVKPQN